MESEIRNQIKQVFSAEKNKASEKAKNASHTSGALAIARFVAFMIYLICTVYLANERWATGVFVSTLLFVVFFSLLVKFHKRIKDELRLQQALAEINQQELLRMDWKHHEFLADGKEFVDRKHPYSYDLDLFGKGSLFQWINRTVTANGAKILANWLKEQASLQQICQRQEAVKELSSAPTFLQEFEGNARVLSNDKMEITQLLLWIAEPAQVAKASWLRWAYWVLPVHFFLQAFLAFYFAEYPVFWAVLALMINLAVVGRFNAYITSLIEGTTLALPVFKMYAQMMVQLGGQQFESQLITGYQKQLQDTGALASIGKLNRLLGLLEYRLNAVFAFTVNAVLLLDIRWVQQLEAWKAQHHQHLAQWIQVLGEIEALNSLATTLYANPDFTLPRVKEQPFQLKANQIGHPLIHAEKRVDNSFEMDGNGQLVILSGSNMAGKSTFLRTLAINMALAFAGGPVCAKQLVVSRALLFTSMRIEDSLNENLSSFYAELTRLQQLFKLLAEREDVFYMLDEILRGTNSEDRYRGVMSILKRLLKTKASGMISTHDLKLAELAHEQENQVRNFSFESTIQQGKIYFDYQLKAGVCRSFNAYELMKELKLVE